MDILIDKPARIKGYALHRLVAQYAAAAGSSSPVLWLDEGAKVRIRPRDAKPPRYEAGVVLGFSLRACVSRSSGNHHKYLPLADWRGRREWLESKAPALGFEIVGVHVRGDMECIETHDGRRFTVDATEFTGLLRVLDPAAFEKALVTGVGKVGRAFGLGLLLVQ